MVLHLVGLGLADEKDVTVKGLEAIRKSKRVYLEAYTSILLVDKERLEEFYGKKVEVADREFVEQEADRILEGAETDDVSFLVVGDPFGATTHTDLVVRAKERGIPVVSIHNASIMNAVGACGLQLYSYGPAVSIVFFTDTWRPDSFYDKIKINRQHGFHTLCLLDIKVKEQSIENLARGRKIYEPPRYMTVNQAVEQLLEIEDRRREGVYGRDTIAVGMARVGAQTQHIAAGSMEELLTHDFGPPLHTLIIPGTMHFLETELLRTFAISPERFDALVPKESE
ncbi:tetrapyrrole methylase [Hyaloraphidium curvatum]|nr:tetrapyrrole methylase [Hyaloraphidium curvatum]